MVYRPFAQPHVAFLPRCHARHLRHSEAGLQCRVCGRCARGRDLRNGSGRATVCNRKDCLVLRNGWFSFRWSQIFEAGNIPASCIVLKARPVDDSDTPSYAGPHWRGGRDDSLQETRHGLRPHVETSAGIVLPLNYMRSVAAAVHEYGGLFVLDCVASGAIWVDMQAAGVDILISAPQKGWSASPCAALVMMSNRARSAIDATQSSSFACDLKRWLGIMEAYEGGGHAYHATMPTDALVKFRDT